VLSRLAEGFVWGVASAIPALLIVAAGVTVAPFAAGPDGEESVETRILDSGFEPVVGAGNQTMYVVCTRRAGGSTCSATDLGLGASGSN
jgi:hypothetical protein